MNLFRSSILFLVLLAIVQCQPKIKQRKKKGSGIIAAIQSLGDKMEQKLELIQDRLNNMPTLPPPTTTPRITEPAWMYVCEEGFVKFNEHCYYYSDSSMDWSGARKNCQDRGSYLVAINSQEEQDFLVENLPDEKETYYIGLVQTPPEEPMWLGYDQSMVTFTAWGEDNPNCLPGCRVAMSAAHKHKWEDFGRGSKQRYICERETVLKVPFVPSTIATTTPRVCPAGYVSYGDHCYMFEEYKVGYGEARDVCHGQNDYLVSINSEDEQEFLLHQIKTYYKSGNYWIGLEHEEDKLVWDDGRNVNFTAWEYGEPNCMESGCRAFMTDYSNYKWEDAGSHYKRYFICERSQ